MVGPSGDYLKFPYEGTVLFYLISKVHIISEIDCARVITSEKCEIIDRVPNSTEQIFSLGSTSPGALLYDAHEFFAVIKQF